MVHTVAKGGSLLPAAGTLTEEWCYGLGIDCYRYEEADLWWMACLVGEIYAHMVSFQVVTHPGEKLFLGHTRDELIANFHGDIIP